MRKTGAEMTVEELAASKLAIRSAGGECGMTIAMGYLKEIWWESSGTPAETAVRYGFEYNGIRYEAEYALRAGLYSVKVNQTVKAV